MLGAALAERQGRRTQAIRELRDAIDALDRNDLRMHAAAARRRLGLLLGGDEGSASIAAGDAFMREQGVKNLEAMTELNCPGFRAQR